VSIAYCNTDEIRNKKKGNKSMIYKFKGSESYKDLCDLEDKGIISRSDHNVYSPRYKEYLKARKKYLKQKKGEINDNDNT